MLSTHEWFGRRWLVWSKQTLSALGWPNGVVPKCGLQEAGEPASVSKRERHWCHSQRQVALQLLTSYTSTPPAPPPPLLSTPSV